MPVYVAVMGFIYIAYWACWPRIRYTGSCSPKC